jgi:hypothetical protein
MRNEDLVLRTDDPRVDALAEEFVALKRIWDDSSNPDYVRSLEILKTFDDMKLSPWQNSQVSHFVRLS